MQTATEFIKEELNKLGLLDKGQVMTNIFEQAKEMEHNQRGYTKEDVLKAGEIGEINHHDYKHIVKLLDEARAINDTYGSKGSDDLLTEEEIAEFKRELKEVMKKPKTEISDEEIEKASKYIQTTNPDLWTFKIAWKAGAKWYREQLKSRQ